MRMFEGFLCCLLFNSVLLTIADVITTRYFETVKNVNIDGKTLFLVRHSVLSKFQCASICLSYHRCDCVSHVYDPENRACSMYSEKLTADPSGQLVGYVDRTECCFPPEIPLTSSSMTVSSDGVIVTYFCDPSLYKSIGNPEATCTWTGGWAITFQCKYPWRCYHYAPGENHPDTCTRLGFKSTSGDESLAPGCVCHCCQPN